MKPVHRLNMQLDLQFGRKRTINSRMKELGSQFIPAAERQWHVLGVIVNFISPHLFIAIFTFNQPPKLSANMASAYRSAIDAQHDTDISQSDDDSKDSSSTVRGDSPALAPVNARSPGSHGRHALAHSTELRNRVLMLTTRGVSFRYYALIISIMQSCSMLIRFRHRHLLNDLHSLLPHTLKDTKLDTKSSNNYNVALNSLADLHSCNYIFFLEGRKHGQDLYLWLAKAPNGPTVKFHVNNVHTMAELAFGGNCLKGGRGVVVFDKSFDAQMHSNGQESKTLIREMLRGVFCVPSKGLRGLKPFVDRVIGVYGLDGKIWIRIYEIRPPGTSKSHVDEGRPTESTSLVEIGPRLVLTPIVILEGSFGGPIIFENRLYVSPNMVRREARVQKSSKYTNRALGKQDRTMKKYSLGLNTGNRREPSNLDDYTLFG